MENIIDEIKDNVKGVCRIQIFDENNEKIEDIEKENTLNNNFIWDMCRQQLFRSNANKRDMSPLGGVILTKSGMEKNADLPLVFGEVAGYASLFRNSADGENIKEGYSNTTLIKSKDGEMTFEFIFGPNKELSDFDTIWLYAGQRKASTSTSANGGFYDLVQVPCSNFPSGILSCSNNGFIYSLYNNVITQYRININENGYNFVKVDETVAGSFTETNIASNTSTFYPEENCFILFNGNKIIKMDINGNITLERNDGDSYNGYSGAVCKGDYILRMVQGTIKVYNATDMTLKTTVKLDKTYANSSKIYMDGSHQIIYIHNYDLTSGDEETDIYYIDKDLNFYRTNTFKGGSFITYDIKDAGCLGNNYYMIENKGLFTNAINPCTQDVILNGGTGEVLTFNKPLGYSAKITYKIFFKFNDVEEQENNKINPRAFQDMFLNMLLPQKRGRDYENNGSGLNVFGSFMILDNGDNGDSLTTEHTKRVGFAYSYKQDKCLNYPTLQGYSDLATYNINKKTNMINLFYEFDYETANAHYTHVQTGTDALNIAGMNSKDGRCYAPKIVAEFSRDEAQNFIKNYGHKLFFTDVKSAHQGVAILSKSAKNTIIKTNLNIFDYEYPIITSNLSENDIVLEEVNLNNDQIYQVLHLSTTRNFYCFSDQKLYIYDENFNFVEHTELPFVDENIKNTTEQVYFGTNQNMFALITQNNEKYIINYDYLNKKEVWKLKITDIEYLQNGITCYGLDNKYMYINTRTTINGVNAYYILTYKITDKGLELETFNQSRHMENTSLIYTKGFPTDNCFVEIRDSKYVNATCTEDVLGGNYNFTTIYLCKSFPYITATHKINSSGTKTEKDYFMGVFQLKM